MEEDDEIVQEFLVESHENLDQLDRDLVELEKSPSSRELLSSVFRTIHTIKGTSGFLAFGRLETLTHVGENLLSQLREGELTMTPAIAGSLLNMVDGVRALLAAIERTGADVDESVDVDSMVALIKTCLENGDAVAAEPVAVTEPEPVVVPEPVAVPEHVAVPDPVAVAVEDRRGGDRLGGGGDHRDPDAPERRGVADSTVRVDVDLLDTLVRLVGELVLTRNQILQQADVTAHVDLVRASQRLNLVASELQETVMRTRMQPIGQVWAKIPRLVRDLGAQLGRTVKLEMEGQDTELDRSLLEAMIGGVVATYVDDGGVLRAVIGWDLAAAANIGAAVGLVPSGAAEDAVEEQYLPENLLDNLSEVSNVRASAFQMPSNPHLRLEQTYRPAAAAPTEVTSLMYSQGQRLDLDLDVPRYGKGRFAVAMTM